MKDLECMQDVLAHARTQLEPSLPERERVKRSLAARIGAVGVLGTMTATPGAAAATAPIAGQSLLGLAKVFVSSVALTAASATVVTVAVDQALPRVIESASEPPRQSATVEVRPSATRGVAREPKVGARIDDESSIAMPPHPERTGGIVGAATRASETEAEPRPKRGGLDEELELLQKARQALAGGRASEALGVLNELDERHRRGALLEERWALRAIASCQNSGSRSQARRFLKRHPSSIYAGRVRARCPLEPKASFATGEPEEVAAPAERDELGPGSTPGGVLVGGGEHDEDR